jgi:hypothetical protein
MGQFLADEVLGDEVLELTAVLDLYHFSKVMQQ